MSATIITFPIDRCRKPASVIEAAERAAFSAAADQFAAQGNAAPAIAEMMRLACGGVDPIVREEARGWLWIKCNVSAVD